MCFPRVLRLSRYKVDCPVQNISGIRQSRMNDSQNSNGRAALFFVGSHGHLPRHFRRLVDRCCWVEATKATQLPEPLGIDACELGDRSCHEMGPPSEKRPGEAGTLARVKMASLHHSSNRSAESTSDAMIMAVTGPFGFATGTAEAAKRCQTSLRPSKTRKRNQTFNKSLSNRSVHSMVQERPNHYPAR